MDEVAVRLGVQELIAAYVDCIDEDRLEDWPDFFVEQCRYVITSRTSHEAGLPHGVVYAASRGMLIDRITALRQANIFEPHRYRHIVGPIRIEQVDATVSHRCDRTLLRCASCTTARWGSSPPAAISTASL